MRLRVMVWGIQIVRTVMRAKAPLEVRKTGGVIFGAMEVSAHRTYVSG